MSDVAVDVRWVDGLRFEATGKNGVPVFVDGDAAHGPTPMESLLAALAGCMGVDVVDILNKMRVPFGGLTVRVQGDRRSDPPRRLTAVRLVYEARGVVPGSEEKLRRAVDLSRDKYCSVLHSLQPDLELSIQIESR